MDRARSVTQYVLRTRLLTGCFLVLVAGCDRADEQTDEASTDGSMQSLSAMPDYVGSEVCAGCHVEERRSWLGSHHQLAMALPAADVVVGDFADTAFYNASTHTKFSQDNGTYVVRTEGADGNPGEFSVRYTFGVAPLQQYLLELPGGRLQAHNVAWDARPEAAGGQRWFHLQPGEAVDHSNVLHWTRDSQNWNFMCADCHSTALEKNYDASSGTYATEFAEISVGCEACHGPGSEHVANPGYPLATLNSPGQQLNACAPCHSRRSQLAEGFRPSRAYLDHYLPALLEEGLYHPDGQILDEVYVYGSFLQSKMYARGVACGDCHDPHSGALVRAGNAVCTQCHSEAGRAEFPTLRLADYDSRAHHWHAPASDAAQCVSCHMPSRTYMVIDDRRDHSFRIPRPDLTVALGVPNACNGCHGDRSAQWARDIIAERFGDQRAPHFAAVFAAARVGDPAAEAELAAIAGDESQPAMVRATALALMLPYERGVSTFAIERGLADANPLVRIGALRAAERWPPRRRFEKCQRLLDDDLLAVRTEAARRLAPAFAELDTASQRRLRTRLEAYLQSLQLTADRAEGQTNIANVYLYLGEAARAERALEAARKLNPQWVPALVNLADLYRATGRDRQAGPLLAEALELAPATPDVLVARALWLVRQESPGQALGLLAKAHELAPQNVRHAYVYAVALHSAGQSESALAVLDGALKLRPRDKDLLQTAFAIARELGAEDKMAGYLRQLESRWSP